ncbi:PLDc N-terminal domain-containing protein [Kocuria turfanensis]|uniref:Cardiolipin synthase N-terminal domain-containing protein n=1 Tax=Kocuria turfanensis TaxID=388357 RepID=A0A512IB11_9MICC|nr:PLDc N-terminal domain-containing protein [Kocuria turfanensis]GEO94892.1 hypothetical protein KTU01_10150 [Kocuria turfanensis]
MGRAILIIGAAALAVGVIVYSLIECARTDSAAMRGLRKGGWIAVIVLLPLLGALLWLFLGRPRGTADSSAPARGKGPDDDPQFLRNLEERRRQQEQAEKLRRWEEELRRGDGSTGGRPGPAGPGNGSPGGSPGGSSAGRADDASDDSPGKNRPPRD